MVAELLGVTKRFRGLTAVDGVDLRLEPGKVTALLGPNGAGKTTTVRLLLGLTRPTSGTVRLFGEDPTSPAARQRTGVMLQVANVPETLRVREHVHLFCSYYPSPLTVEATLAAAGISHLADRKYGELSSGQRQRVHFALAICGNPDLLCLDEPTVGLDVESRRAFWQEVRALVSRGRTILLTTHYLEEADALADRVVVMNQGAIVADGAPHEMKQLAASRRIRCATALTVDRLQQMPGVASVRRDGATTELLTNDAERVTRDLLIADTSLSGLEVTGAGLEEAFLALTSARGQESATVAGGVR
ncbi:MAG: ABC transporter ATP-binding protein [Acidobacteriota bacterium]|nr:ABC transporter ATP-binding protein [Acidobacteriota bacterium]